MLEGWPPDGAAAASLADEAVPVAGGIMPAGDVIDEVVVVAADDAVEAERPVPPADAVDGPPRVMPAKAPLRIGRRGLTIEPAAPPDESEKGDVIMPPTPTPPPAIPALPTPPAVVRGEARAIEPR